MKLRTFDDLIETDLKDDLSDPEFARGYLEACLEEAQASGDMGVFLVAILDVAKARGSVASVAERAGKTRASFYKSLSEKGNPEFATIARTLPSLGMKFQVGLIESEEADAVERAPNRFAVASDRSAEREKVYA